MAEIHGKIGAIYYRKAYIRAATIAFVDNDPSPDTITDSGSGLVTAGFEDGDLIVVTGSTSNDGTYDVTTAIAGTLTLDAAEALTNESAGATVTIVEALPGTQAAGFTNWTLDPGVDLHEVTDYSDAGIKKYIAGNRDWTATAERHWLTDTNYDTWFGTEVMVRFFVKYVSSPSGGDKAYFYEGPAFVSGIDTNHAQNEIVTQSLRFQGTLKAEISGTGIAFVDSDPDTITDTGNGFLAAGFQAGDRIYVSGSTSNDGYYTIDSVAAGTITLIASDALTAEAAGDYVSIIVPMILREQAAAWPS